MPSDQPSAPVGVPLGEVIGGYRLVELIGAGSTSHVYLAHHARLGRPAAIKVLHADLVDNPKVVQRMLTEAKVVNDIRHPNIVDIIDFVDQEQPRRVALVMEHVPGPTVDRLRGGEPLPWRQASGIARQLVEAVEAAHQAGVIHRDLKPDNLLLASDPRGAGHIIPQLKVVDFGIAKVAGPGFAHQTATQTMLGTPAYMAPEQIAQSPPPSTATDVFAVGEILYELLSGQRAYRAARLSDVVRQKLRGEVPDLPLPAMPGRVELQTMVRRCLAFRPEDRPRLVEIVGLLSALQSLPSGFGRDAGVGATTIPSSGWDDADSTGDPLADATQLSEVVGGLQGQQTQALWRPESRDGAPAPEPPDPAGTSSPTHLALKPNPVDALEETEPFSSGEIEAQEPYVDAPTVGRAYDLDSRSLNANTALSAEAVDDDFGDDARSGGPYEEMETRDSLPSLEDEDDSGGFSDAGPLETLIAPPATPADDAVPDERTRVPARDGGPAVAPDDPLAARWSSTVIRPKPRDWAEADAREPAEPSAEARGGGKWQASLERAMRAQAGAGAGAGTDKPTPVRLDRPPLQPARPEPASPRGEAGRSDRGEPVRGEPFRGELSRPEMRRPRPGSPSVFVAHRSSDDRFRSPWLLVIVPATLAVLMVVYLLVRPGPDPRRSPAVMPVVETSVQVRSQPAEAFVEDARTGAFLGKTPVSVDVPTGGTRNVRVFKAGFTARVVELSADAPSTWVPLVRE